MPAAVADPEGVVTIFIREEGKGQKAKVEEGEGLGYVCRVFVSFASGLEGEGIEVVQCTLRYVFGL